jgi:hypothetical protein
MDILGLLVFVAVTLTLTTVKGQTGNGFKPGKGRLTLEAGFAPLAMDSNNVYLPNGQIRAVYMLSDKLRLRLGIGLDADSDSDDNGLTGDEWISTTNKSSEIKFTPGIAYYLSGTERLAPYAGAEVIFATKSKTSIHRRTQLQTRDPK